MTPCKGCLTVRQVEYNYAEFLVLFILRSLLVEIHPSRIYGFAKVPFRFWTDFEPYKVNIR